MNRGGETKTQRKTIVIRVNSYFQILQVATQLHGLNYKYMKTYRRCKHHKHSPLKHKTIRTTTAIETSMIGCAGVKT